MNSRQKNIYMNKKNSGAVIHEIGETGLLLYFDNQQEETIAFRTDIDALPVKEETNLSFASKHEGYMHACGHDGHMAMLLGLTDFITKHIEDLIYNVVLIYQPSEEISVAHKALFSQDCWINMKYKQYLAFIYGLD